MKKIAIIGAGYLQLPLVLKANEMGVQTYCFAILDAAVCKEACYKFYEISITEKEKILAICKNLKVDAVLSIGSDLAVSTVNYIAHHMNLVGNPIQNTDCCTDKYWMKKALSVEHISVAKFAQGSNPETFNYAGLSFPLIVKPTDRSGSRGVSIINTSNEFLKAYKTAVEASFKKSVIVEEFIQGREISIETISYNGNHTILATTDKVTTGSPNFVETEHHQPAILSKKEIHKIQNIIPRALSALKIVNGASHIELFITKEDEIVINEIGARMGGDFIGSTLVELSTGYDYLKAVIEISLGNKPPKPMKLIKKSSGIIFRTHETQSLFDATLKKNKDIIIKELSLFESIQLKKSADRGNYFIYQSEKKINLA